MRLRQKWQNMSPKAQKTALRPSVMLPAGQKRVGRSGAPPRYFFAALRAAGRSVGTPDPQICFAALHAAGRSVGRTESGSEKSEKEGRSAGMFSVLKTSHRLDGLSQKARAHKYGAFIVSLVNLPLRIRHYADHILLLALYNCRHAPFPLPCRYPPLSIPSRCCVMPWPGSVPLIDPSSSYPTPH